jgi:hypothetical protein
MERYVIVTADGVSSCSHLQGTQIVVGPTGRRKEPLEATAVQTFCLHKVCHQYGPDTVLAHVKDNTVILLSGKIHS